MAAWTLLNASKFVLFLSTKANRPFEQQANSNGRCTPSIQRRDSCARARPLSGQWQILNLRPALSSLGR